MNVRELSLTLFLLWAVPTIVLSWLTIATGRLAPLLLLLLWDSFLFVFFVAYRSGDFDPPLRLVRGPWQ